MNADNTLAIAVSGCGNSIQYDCVRDRKFTITTSSISHTVTLDDIIWWLTIISIVLFDKLSSSDISVSSNTLPQQHL